MSKLKKILLKARRQVFSEMVGNNPSIFQGEGYDFIELREYMPGDDIRHIDWNITAKLQKPFIKIFREERELNVVLVSVLNGSMHFGSKRFKQEVVADIVALLGFSVLKNGDLLSSYIFTDKMESHLKPSKNIHQVQTMVFDVLNFDALNQNVDFDEIAKTLFKRLKRKSLIIVVGDFFEIPDFKLLAKKHEVLAVVVRDKLEENPPAMGFSSIIDPQSGDVLENDFSDGAVTQYAKNIKKYDLKLYENFKKQQIRFTKIYTDSTVGVGLRRLFEAR